MRRAAFVPTLDRLWLIVVLAFLLFYASIVPQPPNDLWWHLRIGRLIVESGHIPRTNLFAWTLPADTPFTYAAWLGEVWLYLLHAAGGVALLLFSRTLIVGIAFWLTAMEAERRSGSARIAAMATLLLGLMTFNNLIVRTQMWSWLPFVLILRLLRRYGDGEVPPRRLAAMPLLIALWSNLHGAFVLGLVLGGLVALGESWRWLRRPAERPFARLKALWLAVGASALAVMANPRGAGLYRYVLNLLGSAPVQQLIVEWQSPTPHGIANTTFFAVVLGLLLLFAFGRRRLGPTDGLLLAFFLWMAWGSQRSVLWFGFVAAPILAEQVAALLPSRLLHADAPRNALNLVLALLVWLPVLLVQPWWVEEMPLPATYRAQVWHGTEAGPLLDRHTPVKAVAYLRDHPGGRLFNEMGYGSYLIWALPQQKVFIDPRVELFPYEMWLDYAAISHGVRYDRLLQDYGVDRLLIDRELQRDLSLSLAEDREWKLVYSDEVAEIWQRR